VTRSRSITFLSGAAAVALIAVAAAGCGGDDGDSATAASTTSSGHSATVEVANNADLGKILVDSQGRTLYLFQKDSGTKSACFDACAAAWPPLRAAGKPTVGKGLAASKVGTTARSDGKPEVTYNGHPLYTYAGDQSAGDTNGQGLTQFGGGWFALSPAGNMVPGTGSNSGGGSVY
jgi:predicted lipoprotein with Yx(FWY)xxD motif